MFEKARIKLTTWYLLIIMTISLSFSSFIYRSVSVELQRRLNVIEQRLSIEPPRGMRMQGPVHDYFLQDLKESRNKVLFVLLYANGVILFLSAVAGYYLAGKTLKPIEKALNEQKRFVSDASHELKTPLTSLQTSIEVALRDKKLNLKEAKKVLTESLEDVGGMNKLATDLLKLTWYQAGGNNFSLEKVSTRETIETVKKKINPLAKKRQIKIIYKIKNLNIKANKEGLVQLITILIDNAIKYSKKSGGITVSIEKSRNFVVIKVKDKGIGIPKKDIPHIFDRFYRVDQSRSKTNIDGFGLGLSMAKRIVDLHKGTIKVKSEKVKGTIFTVKLPL